MPVAKSPSPPTRRSASERLLDVAAVVFARDGLSSATTREIARTAGVNEVTLFRNFQSKQNLLAAVLERAFETKSNPHGERFAALPPDADLSQTITAFAEADQANMTKNISLMRVLIGEIQHFQEHEMKVLRAIFRPRRQQMVDRLVLAQRNGEARDDFDANIIVDQLVGMVFMGVLRSGSPLCLEYDATSYLRACVQTILRTVELPGKGKAKRK